MNHRAGSKRIGGEGNRAVSCPGVEGLLGQQFGEETCKVVWKEYALATWIKGVGNSAERSCTSKKRRRLVIGNLAVLCR